MLKHEPGGSSGDVDMSRQINAKRKPASEANCSKLHSDIQLYSKFGCAVGSAAMADGSAMAAEDPQLTDMYASTLQ